MPPEFLRWLELISFSPNHSAAKKQWLIVEKFAREIKSEDVFPLVRLAMGLPLSSQIPFMGKFSKAFKLATKPSGYYAVTLEQRILAGAVLVYHLKTFEHRDSDIAGLAMVCVRGWGCIPAKMAPDFMGFAELYLQNRGLAVRKLTKIDSITKATQQIGSIIGELKGFLKTIQGEYDADEEVLKISTKLTNAQNELKRSDPGEQYKANECILLEQGKILLWLLSSIHSTDTIVNPSERAVRAARELSECIQIIPAPAYLQSILFQYLSIPSVDIDSSRNNVHQFIKEIGAAESSHWKLMDVPEIIMDFCPIISTIHTTIHSDTLIGDVNDTQKPQFTLLELAHQLCHELALIKAVKEL